MNRMLAVMFVLLGVTLARAADFPHPDRIKYDAQCLTIDGKDTLVFSAAFHYFRCPKALWPERFAKIKEAGCNAVETYVAWNWHEKDMPAGLDDFSKVDMTDLADWMKMAHEQFGLYTIIRPGPYICAEWAGGGFPTWLMLKKPAGYNGMWLRSDEPTFLNWSKHWLDACNKVVAPEQITRKPVGSRGVIMYQIENEYDLLAGFNDAQRTTHLKALYSATRDGGIDVPIITCWTRQCRGSSDEMLKNVFDGPNSYPRWNIEATGREVDRCRAAQANAPLMIPECQGGWFAQVGGVLSEQQDGVTAAQCNGISMMALAHGVTILNYYMFFGGTNFGDWGSRTQTTTYDYASPIREHGGVDDKYQAVKAIGLMLQRVGPTLARAKLVPCRADGFDSNIQVIARRAADGQTFVFCWNRNRQRAVEGAGTITVDGGTPQSVNYSLAPFGFKLLWINGEQSTWLPEPVAPIDRPAPPAAVRVAEAMTATSPEPLQWSDVAPGATLASMGVYDSRYVMYRSKVTLTGEQAGKFKTLQLEMPANDPVVVRANGKLVTASRFQRRETIVALSDSLRAGENEIVLLYENLGYPNFGPQIEQQSGISSGALTWTRTPDVLLTDWRAQILEEQRPGATTQPSFDDSAWPSFVLDTQTIADFGQPIQPGAEVKHAAARILFGRNNTRAVFRATLDITEEMLANGQTQIVFERLDDQAVAYINGAEAGRSRNWERPLSIDGSSLLKLGKNSIAVVVTNREGEGGITRPVRLVGTHVERVELTWQLAKDVARPDSGWQKVTLGSEPSAEAGAMMNWYRLEFELPEASKDIWVPWLARINATGNGMIWLNGQNLGRYWQVGPQRDYFLPSCWLNFGAGKKNVMLICLRPTDKPLSLAPVEIAPYSNAAERR